MEISEEQVWTAPCQQKRNKRMKDCTLSACPLSGVGREGIMGVSCFSWTPGRLQHSELISFPLWLCPGHSQHLPAGHWQEAFTWEGSHLGGVDEGTLKRTTWDTQDWTRMYMTVSSTWSPQWPTSTSRLCKHRDGCSSLQDWWVNSCWCYLMQFI